MNFYYHETDDNEEKRRSTSDPVSQTNRASVEFVTDEELSVVMKF